MRQNAEVLLQVLPEWTVTWTIDVYIHDKIMEWHTIIHPVHKLTRKLVEKGIQSIHYHHHYHHHITITITISPLPSPYHHCHHHQWPLSVSRSSSFRISFRRFRANRRSVSVFCAMAWTCTMRSPGGWYKPWAFFFSRTAPHGGVIFALKTVKNTGIYGVLFCDKSRLKTVILEQKIEFTSKGYHMLS